MARDQLHNKPHVERLASPPRACSPHHILPYTAFPWGPSSPSGTEKVTPRGPAQLFPQAGALVQAGTLAPGQAQGGLLQGSRTCTRRRSGNTQEPLSLAAPASRTHNHDQAYTPINESDSVKPYTGQGAWLPANCWMGAQWVLLGREARQLEASALPQWRGPRSGRGRGCCLRLFQGQAQVSPPFCLHNTPQSVPFYR